MRIAVCLSSESRTYTACAQRLREFFEVEDCQVDYFVHTWDRNTWALKASDKYKQFEVEHLNVHRLKANLDKLFSPKAIVIEKEERDFKSPGATYQQYSAYYANCLKSEYENKNGFIYDVVVKTRMDITWSDLFKFDPTIVNDSSCVYVPCIQYNIDLQFPMIWDRMYFGTSLAMDRASLVFKDTLMRANTGLNCRSLEPEKALYSFFKRSNITPVITGIHDTIVRQPAMHLNACTDFEQIATIEDNFWRT